jgi:NAD-dependent deacetylase
VFVLLVIVFPRTTDALFIMAIVDQAALGTAYHDHRVGRYRGLFAYQRPPGARANGQHAGGALPGAGAMIRSTQRWIADAKRVVALTGAGISTESGIPDFRGPQGVWTRNPLAEKLSDIRYYMSDPEVRRASWQSRLAHPAWSAKPNAGHLALADLEKVGKLHALITQNIDGLHQMAGNSSDTVIEVHGTLHKVMCMACNMTAPMETALERVRAGEDDPRCRDCGGILKSATISFGQPLVPQVIDRAMRAAAEADLFLAIGTSLLVYPVAGAVTVARNAGARIVIINAEETPFDAIADAVMREPIGTVLPKVVSVDPQR